MDGNKALNTLFSIIAKKTKKPSRIQESNVLDEVIHQTAILQKMLLLRFGIKEDDASEANIKIMQIFVDSYNKSNNEKIGFLIKLKKKFFNIS